MQSSRSLRPVVRAKQCPGQVLKDCAHPIKIAEHYFFTDCIIVILGKKQKWPSLLFKGMSIF